MLVAFGPDFYISFYRCHIIFDSYYQLHLNNNGNKHDEL